MAECENPEEGDAAELFVAGIEPSGAIVSVPTVLPTADVVESQVAGIEPSGATIHTIPPTADVVDSQVAGIEPSGAIVSLPRRRRPVIPHRPRPVDPRRAGFPSGFSSVRRHFGRPVAELQAAQLTTPTDSVLNDASPES